MDKDRFTLQVEKLGAQRMPAAILLLWSVIFSLVSTCYAGTISQMGPSWWLSRLTLSALVILIFIGKKNLGLLIPIVVLLLLSLQRLFTYFNMSNLLYTAGWAALCLIAISAAVPQSGLNRSLPKGLSFLPAGLFLAMGLFDFISYVTAMGYVWFFFSGLFYLLNDLLWALGILLLARALTEEPFGSAVSSAAGGVHFKTYIPPKPCQPVVVPAAPGVLLVRFSIDKLNELNGPYGFQSGRLIGQAVPAALLEGMTISDGDSAATLAGREYVCEVSITAMDSSILKEKIEPLIMASSKIRENGAHPVTLLAAGTNEPLVVNGIVRNGRIEGRGGWCASGLMKAWKEAAECGHEWIPVNGEWTEICAKCGHIEPAGFKERTGVFSFPMACVPDSDLDIIMTALQMKSMIRLSLNEVGNEFRALQDKLQRNRNHLLSKEEWNTVFLALSTYGSTSPASCPPIYAALLWPEKQQRVMTFLLGKWMALL